jgi:transketolase
VTETIVVPVENRHSKIRLPFHIPEDSQMSLNPEEHDPICIDTLRMLAVDMVEAARSGHPGLPLGASPIAYLLWTRFLRHNPENPGWPNRDRFILSAGHGSALLYALLHLSGYDLPMEELKRFRQWGSRTPGHPEYGLTPGVEATAGPLGQGFAMGVGMALAERFLARMFNRPGFPVVDHHTYAIVSDGDLMEGVAAEAASLAGFLRLGKLIYLYDDNHTSIEGPTEITFTEDVGRRFEAYGWHVQRVADGYDLELLDAAIRRAREDTERPSLVMIRTHIGYGSPLQDNCKCHGAPLGPEKALATKKFYNWPEDTPFFVPLEARAMARQAIERGKRWEQEWRAMMEAYRNAYPAEIERLENQLAGRLPDGWETAIPAFRPHEGPAATRAASGRVINALAEVLPHMVGGSADLGPSNKTVIEGGGEQRFDAPKGRNIHFGVREHAMGAMVNGMALHGGVIPYGGTFLVFSDYMRPPLRMAALMEIPSVFVFTHDSIAVGEDGPTHQPVEHLASLRVIPNLTVLRPADANETAAAWRIAVARRKPAALALSRQKLPILDPDRFPVLEGVPRGGYVLADCEGTPDVILLATGSEVHMALEARETLSTREVRARVVSMPSWELFSEQPQEYRDRVLPPEIKARIALEAGSPMGWHRWVGDGGEVIGVDRFGASGPGSVVMEHYGLTVKHVVARALSRVGK